LPDETAGPRIVESNFEVLPANNLDAYAEREAALSTQYLPELAAARQLIEDEETISD